MARRKACAVGGRGCSTFLRYLEETLIPDTVDSGRRATAADLRAVVKFLRGADRASIHGKTYGVGGFIQYLKDTLIPDLEEEGSAYADDFDEALSFLRETSPAGRWRK